MSRYSSSTGGPPSSAGGYSSSNYTTATRSTTSRGFKSYGASGEMRYQASQQGSQSRGSGGGYYGGYGGRRGAFNGQRQNPGPRNLHNYRPGDHVIKLENGSNNNNNNNDSSGYKGPASIAGSDTSRCTAVELEKKKQREVARVGGNYGAAYYTTMSIEQLRRADPYLDVNRENQILESITKSNTGVKTPMEYCAPFDAMNDVTNFSTDFSRWIDMTQTVHMEFAYRAIRDANRDPNTHSLFVFIEYLCPKFDSEYQSRMMNNPKGMFMRTNAHMSGKVLEAGETGLTEKEIKERFKVRGSKMASEKNIEQMLLATGYDAHAAIKQMEDMKRGRELAKRLGKCAGFVFLAIMVNGTFKTNMCMFKLDAVPGPDGSKYSITTATESVAGETKYRYAFTTDDETGSASDGSESTEKGTANHITNINLPATVASSVTGTVTTDTDQDSNITTNPPRMPDVAKFIAATCGGPENYKVSGVGLVKPKEEPIMRLHAPSTSTLTTVDDLDDEFAGMFIGQGAHFNFSDNIKQEGSEFDADEEDNRSTCTASDVDTETGYDASVKEEDGDYYAASESNFTTSTESDDEKEPRFRHDNRMFGQFDGHVGHA